MERSQKYDWFKGSSQKDKKKDFKQNVKTVLKFSKIFFIFFIMFVSLWGCVQGFTLKQSNYVGRGTEFYLNEKEIPPHITEWKEHGNASSSNPEELYYLDATGANIWLNRENEKSAIDEMVKTHEELTAQGVKSMADAYGGVNEAIRVVDTKGKSIGNTQILFNGDKPIVGSTESKTSADLANNNTIESSLGVVSGNTTTSIKYLLGWDDTNKIATFKTVDFAPRDDSKLNNDQKAIAQVRDNFRSTAFAGLNQHSWIVDALTLSGNYAITEANHDAAISKVSNAQDMALKVLNYLGYSFDASKDDATKSILKQAAWDQMPGLGGEKYVPFLTWKQAWERGVGPFYGLAVFPISKFTVAVTDAFPFMRGWETLLALIVVIFTLRFIAFAISFKSTIQQTKMQELNLKKAAIDAKYAPYKGNKQMQARQRQEVSEMYKKEGVSPMGTFTSLLITMPLFLAIWRVIGSIPHVKSTVWLGINFSETSWRKLFAGEVLYLPLMIVALGSSIGSQLFPKILTMKRDKMRSDAHLKKAMKKNDKTQIIIMIVFAAMSVIFTAGLQIYWIVVSIWSVMQSYATHMYLKHRHNKVRQK